MQGGILRDTGIKLLNTDTAIDSMDAMMTQTIRFQVESQLVPRCMRPTLTRLRRWANVESTLARPSIDYV